MKRSTVGSAAAQKRQNMDWLPWRVMSIGTSSAPSLRSAATISEGTLTRST